MRRENVEDVYRLSPVQQGMLFHCVRSGRAAMYLQQFQARFGAGFDAAAFARAWQALLDGNPALRTFFLWRDLEEPVQIVERRVELPVETFDWSDLASPERAARLAELVATDRRRGFDLSRAPLMRLSIVRLGDEHRVVWTYHHLILDGWSVGALLQEAGDLYQAFAAGRPRTPVARRPFRDYVAWLRAQGLAEAEEYWKSRLAGFAAPTPLGIDAPSAARAAGGDGGDGTGMGIETVRFSAAETAAIKAFAQSRRLTVSTLAQGAWALVLSRYAREEDVVFGLAVSGRPPALAGAEAMLGCFINTLPVRARVPGGAPVVPWLQEMQAEQARLRRFEHSPLVEVQGWSEVPRGTPLFASVLVFENYPAGGGFDVAAAFQRTNYPLTLVFGPVGEMFVRADYELAHLAPETVRRLLGHLKNVLAAFLAGPEAPLATIELAQGAERAELIAAERTDLIAAERADLVAAGGAARSTPPIACLHELFAAQAARRPAAIAVSCEGERLTYGELESRANRLARQLRRLGVGPEVLAGVCLERSLDLVVALLAVLKAGGAYLPLDPRQPEARLAFMVEDAGAAVVVASAELAARLPRWVPVVCLDEQADALAAQPDTAPDSFALPESLAYVIYTSGSTGRPKGTLVTHANVARLLAATDPWFGFAAADVSTLFHSYAFDFSVWELWGALAYGGRLVVVPYLVSRSPAAFRALLASEGVTVLSQTPSAFRQLDAADAEAGAEAGALALRTVVFGGEALEPAMLAPWFARHGDRRPRLVNMYGITETTVHVTYRPLAAADAAADPEPAGGARSPIGRAIPDLALHVLDPYLHPAPLGVPGELAVGGPGLARGYLGRPELTAERFLPHPFAAAPGERIYASGDLVRRLPGGEIDYLGRIDQQVKVRGFRVEPGEIEAVLAQAPAVAQAAVRAGADAAGERRLVAYVVPAAPGESVATGLLGADLRAFLRERLPEHMVPAAFVALPAFPLTGNGKVDRRALAALAPADDAAPAPSFAAARTPVEEILAALWCEVLGRERVGVDESFFDLGGHSLLATRVLARLRQAFGVEVPLAELFERPTIAGLAPVVEAAIAAGRSNDGEPPLPPLPPIAPRAADDGPLPLSFAQERLWFLDRLTPGSAVYNVPAAVDLAGELSPAALAAALAEVAARHETLRTVFTVSGAAGDRPVQVVLPPPARPAAPLPLADLAGLAPEVRAPELDRLARAEAARPFDLATGPLLRAVLLRAAPAEHRLLLTQHHIVSDLPSMAILVGELAAAYAAAVEGRPAALPPLPIQYADFALWQRRTLAGERLARQLAYWRERLAGVPALELPADRPRPALPSYRGGDRFQPLPAELAAGLRALSRRQGATLFMTALAAFAALLARLSGQEDFAVGSPAAGRAHRETEGLIGFFVNTLALRVDAAGDSTVARLLAGVRAAALGAYAAQELPFERVVQLVQEAAPERSLARSPIFQAMLIVQEGVPGEVALPGLALRPLPVAVQISKFDLTLTLVQLPGGGLAAQWVYARDLFDAATVERWSGHLERLVEGLIGDPPSRLSDLPLLSPAERDEILVEWNRPPFEYAGDGMIHELVRAQAARTPAAPAVTYEGESWSYGRLVSRARAIARRLRRLGVRPESLVALAVPRSPEMVAAILGVFEAGGAYVPLDPDLPAERLAYLLADSGARLVLTQGSPPALGEALSLLNKKGEDGRRPAPPGIVRLDDPAAASAEPPEDGGDEIVAPDLLPDHPAYVIYTSGSTGRPKGVVVSHRSLGNRGRYAAAADMGPDSAVLQKTTVAFDVSVMEIFSPLLAGGRTVLIRPGGQQDPDHLVEVLERERVTDASFPPSLLAALLEREAFTRLPALRNVVTGGETVPPALPAAFHARMRARLANRYGPTETTVSVTSSILERGSAAPRALAIGRPTAKARLYVLDRALQPVPVGVAGELYVGGVCVARGYHRRPELTAAAFVPDMFSALSGVEPGGRLYRTGDLVRYRPDGALEFAGRIAGDSQVKIRGFRVELGEIEAALASHPGIALAAVVLPRDRAGEASPFAYLVAAGEAAPSAAELRAHLASRLPAYMVPAGFAFLPALPVTPTGKIDRRALAARTPAPEEESGSAPPRGPLEERIAGIWEDVLGRPRVGRDDDFFALGGHSLLATRVAARLARAAGVQIPLRTLFEATTVAALARELEAALARREESAQAAPGASSAPPLPEFAPPPKIIRRVRRPGARSELPLSFSQERLWFLDRLEPGRAVYNIPAAFLLTGTRGRFDRRALAASLATVAARHEILRTTYAAEPGGRPVQRVAPPAPAKPLPLVDLAALPAARRRGEAERLAAREAARPFDLGRGPVLRATLVHLGDAGDESEHALLFTLHHIAADGWSVDVLVREVGALYGAFAAGRPSPLPELPIQYGDYALWQRRWLSGPTLAAEILHWRRELAGLAPLELPTDRPRPAASTYAGATHPFRLPPALAGAVDALGRRRGATRFMVLLAAFQALLHRLSGQDDLAVGTPIAGRRALETEDLIGFFVNTLVLRADLAAAPGFAALVDQARERTLTAYGHQDLPFEKLIGEVSPERHLARSPLVQVVFVMLDPETRQPSLAGLALTPLATPTGTAKFDLTLTMGEGEGGLGGLFEHSTDLFDRGTIARLADRLAILLEGMLADPARPVADVAWLAPAERRQLAAWSPPEARFPVAGSLHGRFAAAAARDPLAVAAVCDGASLTYGEANARANRLARHLAALGVGPESPVALCLDRSLDQVVAILGVLKAGGAYVPLDPAYPAERLASTVEDAMAGAASPVLVTAGAAGEGEARPWWSGLALARPLAVVHLDADAAAIERHDASDLPERALPESLAYVIYTSGSTGRPKGVLVTHGNVLRLFAATDAWFRFGAGDVWTLFHSYAFDFSVWEIWGALLHGGRLVVVPRLVARSPEDFLALLAREKVTVLNQTPSAFRQLAQADSRAASRGREARLALRAVIFGGEALEVASLAPWIERRGDARPRLVNMYGITETTVHVTYRPIARADLAAANASPIGEAIPDLRVHLLDRRGHAAGIGVAGEMYVGGAGVARGYLGRPELTAERFVPDPSPSGAALGARLYRSGDLALRRGDRQMRGELDFLGRADSQVKIRGFRIEPGEIAAALARHPAVGEAVVLAREDRPGDRRLVAYVTVPAPADRTSELASALRAFLRERLPEHMVPAAFVALDAFPLTPNGKLDRRALPAPEVTGSAAPAAPRSPLEETLARVWREVLRVERLGIHDNFFELGGDSILGIQVISRLAQEGWRLSPRQIFEQPTVAGLAAVARPIAAGEEGEGPLVEEDAAGPPPLTPAQLWLLEQDLPDLHHVNQSVLLAAAEPLSPALLDAAWAAVAARHAVLSYRFARDASGAGWRAVPPEPDAAHPPRAARVAGVDLSALPVARRRAALEAAAASVQGSLDLAAGPLHRAVRFAVGEGEPDRVLIVVHHLVVDGVSWRILLEDLETAYRQLAAGRPLALAVPTTPFARWAGRLARHALTPAARAEAGAWLQALAARGGPIAALPVDPVGEETAGENTVGSLQAVAVALGEEATRALLQQAPRAYRTQVNDLLLAALAQAFAAWTGSPRLLVELEGHGREEVFPDLDLARTVGWFTAIYPVLLDLSAIGEEGDAVKSVKEQLRAVPGRGLSFGLVRYLGDEESATALAALPRPEVVWNYLGQLDQTVAPGRLFRPARESAGPSRSPRQRRPHLLEITASVIEGRLQVAFSYSARRHRKETIERLAASYLDRLSRLVEHCVEVARRTPGLATPSDFPLARLGQSELDRILRSGGDIAPGRVEDVYPASYVQEGLLFHSLEAPESGVYVVQLALAYTHELDVARLERAWAGLVERHAILRTGFAFGGSERALQVVREEVEIPWRKEDWSALSAEEVEARWRELAADDRRRGFDLARPPLLRFALVETTQGYRFLFSHHHLLLDGWSMPIILREIFALFSGGGAALPPPRPYRDYVAWLVGRDLGEAERFFRGMLQGFAAPTPLGVERAERARRLGAPAPRETASRPVPAATSTALRAFVRRHQLTLNTVVQGAWAILLARAGGEEDVVFGAVTSGRSVPVEGIDGMVGLFINTLPVRVEAAPAAPLLPWLQAIQERQVELRQLEYAPLGRVRAWSDVPAGQPLFESILAFENYPVEESTREQTESGLVSAETVEQTHFPLALTVVPGARLRLRLAYDAARLEPTAVLRLQAELEALLAAMLAAPEAALADLSSLTEAERHQLACEWNGPAAGLLDLPEPELVHRRIARQAARNPRATALVRDDKSLSYSDLLRRVNRLAPRLANRLAPRSLPAGSGLPNRLAPGLDDRLAPRPGALEPRVGIFAGRSFERVVGLLAALQAGAVAVPLDPALPAETLASLVGEAPPDLVVTTSALRDALPRGIAEGAIVLGEEGDLADAGAPDLALAEPGLQIDLAIDPDRAACILFTAGSSGRPKPVVVSHRALAGHLLAEPPQRPLRRLHRATFGFDVSLVEILAPLAAGGAVVLAPLAPDGAAGDPAALVEGYGLAETVFAGTAPVGGEGDGPPASRSVGRPVPGVALRLLDRELRPVPPGAPGEICLAAASLARGYLDQPDRTAAAFVPDPFGAAGARLLRSGDLGRFRGDGRLEFLGRSGDQARVRGVRVDLLEVESVLAAHPAVERAAAVVRPGPHGAELAAFYLPRPTVPAPSPADLRALLAGRLPAALVPSALAPLAALPLLPTGKLDRRALAALADAASAVAEGRAGRVPPRTPVELAIAGVWSQVLRRDVADVRDDFFALGGHSLLATQAVLRLRQELAVELPIAALFDAPTVEGLAEAIEAARRSVDTAGEGGAPRREPPPLVPAPRQPGFRPPLSFAQERLWFLDRMQPGTPAYNLPSAVRLEGRLDALAFDRALREVVRRHEALRTSFAVSDAGPVQVIAPRLDLALPRLDLAALPAAARESELRRLAAAEARRPFDLAAGPLARAALAVLGAGEHVALLSLHHVVADAWSMGVLVGEVAALYQYFSGPAFAAGRPSPLPELPVQYADYTIWQRAWLQGEVLDEQLAYWRHTLAGAEPLDLATDRPRPAVLSDRGADERFVLPAAVAAALVALGRRQGITSYVALLAAFAALLHRYTGQDDVVLGSMVAGRNRRELEPLIGFFVNSIALRVRLGGRPGFATLLGRVREAVLGALAHQDLPFEKLVAELQPERDLSRSPLFQVVLELQATVAEPVSLPDLTLRPLDPGPATSAKFDLLLDLREASGGDLAGTLNYSTDLFDRATIARLAAHLVALAAAAAAAPERPLGELPILSAEEERELAAWSRPQSAGAPRTLHARFAAAAARDPQATAATCGEEGISYGDLERQANRLAHHLIDRGVLPGDLVGLCLERSLDLPVAILAVLKAGAAYLPLDPAYPAERLAWMVADSGAAVVVTRGKLAEPAAALRPLAAVRLDAEEEAIARRSPAPPAVDVLPGQPAYVLYTSGSTGRPKGVVVPHAAVDRLLAATEPWFGFGPSDVWTLFHSYAFDFSVWEMWGALAYGGRLVVVPYWVTRSPEAFHRLLADEGVTVLSQTPSAFRQLLWAEEAADPAVAARLALRYVVFGGEALELAALAPWLDRHGDERPLLVNMYGITETTVHVTYRPIRRADLDAGRGSVIGRPIPDLSLHVLEPGLAPQPFDQPLGVPGELCVGGAGLAIGYLGRPDLTAERFVPDPFGSRDGAGGGRLYRSGDRARRLAGGDLEYLGRLDHQVKVRGFRIELQEIEAALLAHPAVREAAVAARRAGGYPAAGETRLAAYPGAGETRLAGYPGAGETRLAGHPGGGETRLAAYVVAGDGGLPPAGELRAFLAGRLPDYMLPADFVVLPALPLTENGKVDRRALPAPEPAAVRRTGEPAPPRNELERVLARLWQEALGVAAVGVDDNFFELGGSSISAAVLVAHLSQALGEPVAVVAIFDAPTVAGLAERLVETHPRAIGRLLGVESQEALADGEPAQAPVLDEPAQALASGERAQIQQQPPPPAGRRSLLVPLQRHGARPPFVALPPGGGSVLCYADLARQLGPEQPFYGIRARGLSEGEPPVERVEEVAELALAELTALDPHGPYRLGGWSYGGFVAYEMACRLAERGREVALLALLDASASALDVMAPWDEVEFLVGAFEMLPLDAGELRVLSEEARLARIVELARASCLFPEGFDLAAARRSLAVYRASARSLRLYRPGRYPGRLTLYRAAERPQPTADPSADPTADPTLGWGALAAAVEVIEVPGRHETMMSKPYVDALARDLRAGLALAGGLVETVGETAVQPATESADEAEVAEGVGTRRGDA